MKNKDEFISLQEATKYCSHSQEYLSLRARQGKLKSVKIGRNWVTKKEWLEEYFINKKIEDQAQYISLQEATKHCDHSQEYLSLLARQGKLKSLKIGRNWVTKKEWLEEYLGILEDEKLKPKIILQIKRKEPPINLPIETSIQRLDISLAVIPKPIIRLRFAAIFFLILFLGGLFLLGQIKPTILPERLKNISQESTITLSMMSSKENQASTVETFERYGRWLKENLESRVPASKTVYLVVDDFINEKLFRLGRFLASPFSKVYHLVFSPEIEPRPKEEAGTKESKTEEPEKVETKEGMVILPSQDKNEDTIKKIKESFSDEVKVEIKDETSGFIIPIFREKEGEKYLYIMVPVKN